MPRSVRGSDSSSFLRVHAATSTGMGALASCAAVLPRIAFARPATTTAHDEELITVSQCELRQRVSRSTREDDDPGSRDSRRRGSTRRRMRSWADSRAEWGSGTSGSARAACGSSQGPVGTEECGRSTPPWVHGVGGGRSPNCSSGAPVQQP